MKQIKVKLIRIIILFIGLVIAHLGVTLFLLAELGSDPFNVFIQGLFRTISSHDNLPFITHGYTHMAISFLIIIILLFVDRSYVKIGTLICMFCGGPIIDYFTIILSPILSSASPFAYRILMNGLGCVILAYGMTIVIKSEVGTGPNDLVAIVISDKIHKKFSIIRIIVDCFFILLGFILAGTVGIGTIICAFLVGPVAGFFLPINERIIQRILINKSL